MNLIDELIKSSSLFASLDADARKQLIDKFTKVELKPNEVLFFQGDTSDSIYLLISGKLSAQLMKGTGTTQIVGYITQGETVGELGALTTEPRSLTIKALKDSVLLKLLAKDFIYICQHYPKVMFAILTPIMTRATNLIRLLSTENRNKHIVIVPANNSISLKEFTEKLLSFSEKYPNLLIVSDYQPEFNDKKTATTSVKEKILQLSKQKKSTRRILYILSAPNTPLASYAFKYVNNLYVAAKPDSEPTIDNHILEKIQSAHLHLALGPNFLLIHPDSSEKPLNTLQWLNQTHFSMLLHVHMDANKEFLRLFRFIRGKAVGVVLSGGGTHGWAHIGAIKALRDAKIPIDMIGGSSVGALVAGCYALNQSYEETYKIFNQIVIDSAHSISWRSLTWPIVSLFDAKKYTDAQKKAFDGQQIEDLQLPYFCVSSNLACNTEEIHTTGILWEKIRASTAIPGIIPPMLINNELHVDGGLINNLPVDIMRQFVGHEGRIIAVELNSFAPDKKKYKFPPVLTFWKSLLIKLRLKSNGYKFPTFIDTFMRGVFVGSVLRSKQNAVSANNYISLNLSTFSMLHSNPEEGEELVKLGYEETLKQLKK